MREDAVKTRQRQQSPRLSSGVTSSSETLAASSTCSVIADTPEPLAKGASASNHNILNVATKSSHTDASSHSDGRVTPPIWRCAATPEDETRRAKQEQILRDQARKDEREVTPEFWKYATTPEDETGRAKQGQILRSQAQEQKLQVGLEGAPRPSSKESKLSRSTQVWDPQPDVLQEPDFGGFSPQCDVLEEPDFDGFTDQEEPPASYFDLPKRTVIHSKRSSHDSTLIIQRPETQEGLKSEEQKGHAPPAALSRASSTRTADRSIPSRATASSTVASSQAWRSNTPASSVSIPNTYVQSSENTASPRKDARASTEKYWRLPEIQEDHGFSPSIFEDREGSNDLLTLQDFAAEKSIGQISSGKKVTVNDAASELSAALPPPITRFRDDEHEFNSNMAKLYGEGGDHGTSKKGSHTIGRSAMKKEKKGFFSKFRSRSQPPRK